MKLILTIDNIPGMITGIIAHDLLKKVDLCLPELLIYSGDITDRDGNILAKYEVIP
jgi:hypothetical protein